MTPSVLIWFRNDLRPTDHPAWHAACASGLRPIPVFIEEPWRTEASPWLDGRLALGARRAQFVAQGVHALQ